MKRASLLLLLSLPTLRASDGPRFGLAAGLSSPMGELRHNQELGTHFALGAHLGLLGQARLNERNELRGQLTYSAFPGGGFVVKKTWSDYSVLQGGLDWIHGFRGLDRGAFMLLGISINRIHQDPRPHTPPPGTPVNGPQTQSGAFGGKVGGGFAFSRRFRLEGQFNQVQVKRYGADGLGFTPVQWVQASAIFQF